MLRPWNNSLGSSIIHVSASYHKEVACHIYFMSSTAVLWPVIEILKYRVLVFEVKYTTFLQSHKAQVALDGDVALKIWAFPCLAGFLFKLHFGLLAKINS